MASTSDTRARLLASTNESFRRKGYHATALKEVVDLADATIGSLYHFFPGGKVELAVEALRESGAAYGELCVMILDAAKSPAAGVRDLFDGAAAVLESTDFIDPCPIGGVAREVANTEERLREVTATIFDLWISMASTRFVDSGLSKSEAKSLASVIVAAIEGGFVIARARRDASILRTIGKEMETLTTAALAAPALRRALI